MIVIPAINLRAGACMLPVEGRERADRIRSVEPPSMVHAYVQCGFRRIHLSEVDATSMGAANRGIVLDLLWDGAAEFYVRGGHCATDDVRQLVTSGARYAVIGTSVVQDPWWLADATDLFEDAIILSVEVQHRRAAACGWSPARPVPVSELLDEVQDVGLAGILVEPVDHRQSVTNDLGLVEDIVDACTCPVYVAGGIASMRELRALEDRSVTGVVVGRALQSGALHPRVVAQEFGA